MNQQLFDSFVLVEIQNALAQTSENLKKLPAEQAILPPNLAMAAVFDELAKVLIKYANDYRDHHYAKDGEAR